MADYSTRNKELSETIKSIAKENGFKHGDLGYIFNCKSQSALNKLNRNTFTIEDIAALCVATNTELIFGGHTLNLESILGLERVERLRKVRVFIERRKDLETEFDNRLTELEEEFYG